MHGSGNSHLTNWRRVSPGSAKAYVFATFCVVIASLARWELGLIAQDIQTFTTYYPAVLFAALIGGVGAGTFAAVLGGIIGWWAFMPPTTSLWRHRDKEPPFATSSPPNLHHMMFREYLCRDRIVSYPQS
jgi:uncharacterized protein DUF4118